MTPQRELEIDTLAEATRLRLFTYNSFPLDLMTALNRVSDLNLSPKASFQVYESKDNSKDEAFTNGKTNTIYLSRTTYEELKDESSHRRFTVAHEFGHLLLHTSVRSRAVNGVDFRRQAQVFGVSKEELEANYFASTFLMPTDLVRQCGCASQLALKCGVSNSAAQIRIETVERQRRRANGELRPIPDRTQQVLQEIRSLGKGNFARHAPKRSAFHDNDADLSQALSLGFLPMRCKVCAQYRLQREGGCMTCRACGASFYN